MEIDYTLVLVATFAQFVLGAFWYSPLLFGKIWMQIMEVTHISKEELQKISGNTYVADQKEMLPFYLLQFILTLVVTITLASSYAMFSKVDPGYSIYEIAFAIWLGFIAPIQISTVIWGNTKKKYWFKQISIMLGMQLVAILLAAFVLSL